MMVEINVFKQKFLRDPQYRIHVPSRVNLIGEHSDYFDNFVMSMAVNNLTMKSLICPRDDDKIRMYSMNLASEEKPSEEFSVYDDRIKDQWVQYVQGAIAMYAEEFTRRKLKGFDLLIDSSIPVGGGLSSSSALTMTSLMALGISNGFTDGTKDFDAKQAIDLINKKDEDVQTKKLFRKMFMMGCWAEYWYGTRGGFNDHLAMLVGKKNFASVSDNREKDYQYVKIPAGLSIVICNTMAKHNQLYSQFDDRKKDVWRGLLKLERYVPGAKNIRDITGKVLEEHKDELTDIEYQRMLHPVTERDRVFEFIKALNNADFDRAGKLLNETHESLKNNYEVSCEELDIMQEAAVHSVGCYGARLVGGGFGGCVIALVKDSQKSKFMQEVKGRYDIDPQISAKKIHCEAWEAISGDGIKIEVL
jgi:galactokinase